MTFITIFIVGLLAVFVIRTLVNAWCCYREQKRIHSDADRVIDLALRHELDKRIHENNKRYWDNYYEDLEYLAGKPWNKPR